MAPRLEFRSCRAMLRAMASEAMDTAAPTVEEVRRISAISSPVIRNLEITRCYGRLSAAMLA